MLSFVFVIVCGVFVIVCGVFVIVCGVFVIVCGVFVIVCGVFGVEMNLCRFFMACLYLYCGWKCNYLKYHQKSTFFQKFRNI
jgi:hypothetical protein